MVYGYFKRIKATSSAKVGSMSSCLCGSLPLYPVLMPIVKKSRGKNTEILQNEIEENIRSNIIEIYDFGITRVYKINTSVRTYT